MTKISKKDVVILNWVSCICCLIWIKKNKVQVLIDNDQSSMLKPQDIKTLPSNIGVQKTDVFFFNIFEIVSASF